MTHYMLFGLPPASSTAALHDRYLSLAKAWHPDIPGNEDGVKIRELTIAWSVLKDPARRRDYDAKLKMEGKQCQHCNGRGQKNRTIKFNRVEIHICEKCKGTGYDSRNSTQHRRKLVGR